jgi:hypothetical protein
MTTCSPQCSDFDNYLGVSCRGYDTKTNSVRVPLAIPISKFQRG